MTPDQTSSIEVMFARLEAKLDVHLAQHGAQLDEHTRVVADHETRLRAVEVKPSVSPRALWMTAVGAGGLLAALSPFLQRIYS